MISASYFDGRSARIHQVELDLSGGVIAVAGTGIHKSYRYADARMGELFSDAPCVLDFHDGARCEVGGADACATVAAALGYRPSRIERWQQRWVGALAALVLLIATLGAGYYWGLPAATERVVAALPASVDVRLGDDALAALLQKGEFAPSRLSKERIAEIDAIFRQMVPASTRLPLTLRVLAMPAKDVPNAMALPNGTIIMTDAMVRHVLGEEEELDDDMRAALAGIFAHEIGHVERRHGIRALARSSLMALASVALMGDFSGVAAMAPVLLLQLDYSRTMENDADAYAVTLMHARGVDPAALAELFDSLEQRTPGMSAMPGWMKKNLGYLSTHPATAERNARFRAAAR